MAALNGTSEEAFNVKKYYEGQLAISRSIMSLLNVTDVMFNDVSLTERFRSLANETLFTKYLQALSETLPTFQLQT